MFTFTIDNADFLNDFYKDLKEYVKESYNFSAKYLINPELMEKYLDHEKATLIIINKSVFQNIFNILTQLDNNMVFSSLSCLETALYNIRLFKVLKSNQNNLYKYIKDEDFDLLKCENIIDRNTDVEKTQEFSVLDFYCHIKNINRFKDISTILPEQINNGNLYMGLSNGNELSKELQNKIKGYMVSIYKALNAHNQMFFNGGLDKHFEDTDGKMFKKFMDYVHLYA